jgi:hypothetical protein
MIKHAIVKEKAKPAQAMFDRLAPFAKLIVPLIFVSSIVYDYTFLYTLGISFHQLSTSFAEHLRSAILWAPISLFIFFVGVGVSFLLMKMLDWAWRLDATIPSEVRTAANSPSPTPSIETSRATQAWFIKLVLWIGRTLIVVGAGFGLLWLAQQIFLYVVDHPLPEVLETACTIWVGVSLSTGWAYSKRVAKEDRTFITVLMMALAYGPALCAYAGWRGCVDAKEMATQTNESWELISESRGDLLACKIAGFRRFETVTIVADAGVLDDTRPVSLDQRQVRLIATNTIKEVRKLKHGSPWQWSDNQSSSAGSDELPVNCHRAVPDHRQTAAGK